MVLQLVECSQRALVRLSVTTSPILVDTAVDSADQIPQLFVLKFLLLIWRSFLHRRPRIVFEIRPFLPQHALSTFSQCVPGLADSDRPWQVAAKSTDKCPLIFVAH